jgi:hypothetical protein
MDTIIRPAKVEDWLYIDSLRKREGNALGFIPKDAYLSLLSRTPVDGRRRWEYQTLSVTVDNNQLTGYCYSSFAGETAKIIQIVVQEDARRWQRASLLENEVRQEAIKRNKSGVTCRVAYDLESNFYWRAMGYIPVKQIISTWLNQKESKSKRPLWFYHLQLDLPMFPHLTERGADLIQAGAILPAIVIQSESELPA